MKMIVDGDNILRMLRLVRGNNSGPGEQFLQRLEMAAATKDWEVTVVFDGPERFLRRESGPLVVRYAPPRQTADTLIERLVYESPDRTQVVVITQDRAIGDLVLGLGARLWNADRLLEEMKGSQKLVE